MRKLFAGMFITVFLLTACTPTVALTDTQEASMREACVAEVSSEWGQSSIYTLTGDSDFWALKQKDDGSWHAYVSVAYTTPNYDVPFHYTRICVADIDGDTITNVVLK